jgi:hypothetical protein
MPPTLETPGQFHYLKSMTKTVTPHRSAREWAQIIVPEAAGGVGVAGVLLATAVFIAYVVAPVNDQFWDWATGQRPVATSEPPPAAR